MNNNNQIFSEVPETKNNKICCKFSYENIIYDQRCKKCKSHMFINSTKCHDEIEINNFKKNSQYEYNKNENKYYKNYRKAYCLNCKTNFESCWQKKKYIFFGLICWKTTNIYFEN